MAYNGVLEDVKRCIKLGLPEKMPVFALTEEFDVGQSGLTYEEYTANAENAALIHRKGIERFNYDWACVYMDDCIEFEPMGVKTIGNKNIPRSVSKFLPASYASLDSLKIPDPYKDGRMPILLDTIRKLREKFGDTVLICGRTPAPFSASTLLYGMQETMLLMVDAPQLLFDTMSFLAEVEINFARAQIDAGAHALWIGDCCASSRFLSVPCYQQFAIEPAKNLLSAIKDMNAFSFYFGAEKNICHLIASAAINADVIGLSENADLVECKAAVDGKVCLMGNLDPINIMLNGTPEMVRTEVESIISKVSVKGGHLVNTGEGVPMATPVNNVETFIQTIEKTWQSVRNVS